MLAVRKLKAPEEAAPAPANVTAVGDAKSD
jgi:hypothetical protein